MVITKREILVCIAITLILLGFGFLIQSGIKDSIQASNEKYYKALKITDDEDTFKYAIKTNIGPVLAHGEVKAVGKVTHPDVMGEYMYIKRVKEKYTQHSRQVAHTRTVSDGKGGTKTETYYTTEYYWTWDYAGKEEYHVDAFTFMGVEFPYGTLYFGDGDYTEMIKESYYIRYKYYTVPLNFKRTIFTNIKENTITDNEVYHSSVAEVIESKQRSGTGLTIGFWILWVFLIAGADVGYMYMENKYLEDEVK